MKRTQHQITIIVTVLIALATTTLNAQWSITGNAGTNASTNFIGTTDNVAFKIRTNNVVRVTVNGTGKVGIGITTPVFKLDVKGGSINTDSVYRIAGNTVLSVKGASNTFVGSNSGYYNTTGSGNTATGTEALYANTTGTQNLATGLFSLHNNTTGGYNIGVGNYSLNNNNGSYNNATGYQSMYTNTSGSYNIAYGMQALYYNSTGIMNNSLGAYSMFYNSTGNNNVATGSASLYPNTTGNSNIAIGCAALYNNTTGGYMVAIGDSALYAQTIDNSLIYFYNNTALGLHTLFSNTNGSYNTAVGSFALLNNVTGDGNTAIGAGSLSSNTQGGNTAAGVMALNVNTTGFACSAFGNSAGIYSNGSYNTFFGASSGMSSTGSDNCFIGEECGNTNQAGFSNSCIGNLSDLGSSNLYNSGAFGFGSISNTTNKIRLGNSAVTVIEGNALYTVSDGRFKTNIDEEVKGLDFIKKLRPVVYNFEAKKFDEFLKKNLTKDQKDRSKGINYSEAENIRYSGFIAQEVEQAARETNYNFNGVHIPANDNDNYSLAYAEFVVPLVKAVQELDKNADAQNSRVEQIENENQQLNKSNQSLNEKIISLENDIASMHSCLDKLCVANELKSATENSIINDASSLAQNNPNPFNENTKIGFYIAASSGKAMIKIFSMNSEWLKSFSISTKGKGQIEISANTLAPGVYTYVLIVDDKTSDTKQMIIVK